MHFGTLARPTLAEERPSCESMADTRAGPSDAALAQKPNGTHSDTGTNVPVKANGGDNDEGNSAATNSPPPLMFRPPSTISTSSTSATTTFNPPPPSFISGPWHVTHSTLPMWRSNKNVVITYTFLPSSSPASSTSSDEPDPSTSKIDDLVTYSPLTSSSLKTVRGIDTPSPTVPAAYNWRGKGWLKIASSHWEVLGWGEEEGGWMVTYFAKTLFTPAGVDFYARRKGGLSEGLVGRLRGEMGRVAEGEGEGGVFGKLRGEVFEVKHDW